MKYFVQTTLHQLHTLLMLNFLSWKSEIGRLVSEFRNTGSSKSRYLSTITDAKFTSLFIFFLQFFLSWKHWQRTTKLLKNILEVSIIRWFLCKQFIFVDYYPAWKHCKSKLMHCMNYFTLKLLFISNKTTESDKKTESSQSE